MASPNQTIRQIVTERPAAAAILERFSIDPCSQSEQALSESCAALQISVEQVLERLSDAEVDGKRLANPTALSTGRLIQHIVRVHHHYVRRQLPPLSEMARKLAGKRGERAPELVQAASCLENLHADLLAHIKKEELVLFPFIAQMDQDLHVASCPQDACFESVMQPIRIMVLEHDAADRKMDELRNLTNGYEPPDWACTTHIAFLRGLQELEADLRQHEHLENDVLFPRAIQMEMALNKRR